MAATDIDNRITRSSGRSASTSLPGPSTSIELLSPPIAEILEQPADPTLTDLPQDNFTLPVDTELQDLLASSERRFPPGTSLNERLRFLVDLHLQGCDLDYAQLPDNVISLNSNFLSLFSTARQQTLSYILSLSHKAETKHISTPNRLILCILHTPFNMYLYLLNGTSIDYLIQ
jgi:hypothetical protein